MYCCLIVLLPLVIPNYKAARVLRGWQTFSQNCSEENKDVYKRQVELIMEFEKEFGISIPDDQAEKIGTVGDAVSYIEANAKMCIRDSFLAVELEIHFVFSR